MRNLLLTTLLVCGAANDDQSLMQQGVGVESVALQRMQATAVKGAISRIGDYAQQMELNGVAKLAVDSLMRELTDMTRVNAYVIDADGRVICQNIIDLLEEVMALFLAQQQAAQTILDNDHDALVACNDAYTEDDSSHRQNVTGYAADHLSCRQGETTNFETSAANCYTVTSHFTTWGSTLLCPKPTDLTEYPTQCDATQCDIGTRLANWDTWFSGHSLAFNNTQITYDQTAYHCVDATAALEAAIADCKIKQQTYESAFCQWKSFKETACATLATCHGGADATFTTDKNTWIPLSEQRINDVVLVKFVICLINDLRSDPPGPSLDDPNACNQTAAQKDGDVVIYGNTYVDVPIEPCLSSETDVDLDDVDAWYDYAYHGARSWDPIAPCTNNCVYDNGFSMRAPPIKELPCGR